MKTAQTIISVVVVMIIIIGVSLVVDTRLAIQESEPLDQSPVVDVTQTEPEEIAPVDPAVQSYSFVLDLSGQNLDQVPDYVFSMTELQLLDLSDNNLTGALPAEIRQLPDLLLLDLSDNQLTGVPAEIGQLRYLEVLNLANNNLTGLPHELRNLGNLRVLDLRGTQYAVQDLEVITRGLPSTVEIKTD